MGCSMCGLFGFRVVVVVVAAGRCKLPLVRFPLFLYNETCVFDTLMCGAVM